MEFNPFAGLYKHNDDNPSLKERLWDTFFVFFGGDFYPFFNEPNFRLGLYDYLLFLIPALILNWSVGDKHSLLGGYIIGVILSVDWGIRILVSSVLTLCAVPFVLLIHFTLGKNFDEFIIPFLTKKWRSMVSNRIDEALAENSSTLSFNASYTEPEYRVPVMRPCNLR